jgi:hypothetical protein
MIIREGETPNGKRPRRLIVTPQVGGKVRLVIVVPHNSNGYSIIVNLADLLGISAVQREATINGFSPSGLDARLTIRVAELAGLYARSVQQDEDGEWYDKDGGYAIDLTINRWQTALGELR